MKNPSIISLVLACAVMAFSTSCRKDDPDNPGGQDVPVEDKTVSVDVEIKSSDSPSSVSFYVGFTGNTSYVLVYKGEGTGGPYKTLYHSQYVSYDDLEPSTEYVFTIVPYSSQDKAGKSQVIRIRTVTPPYDNYFYHQGEYYEVTSVKVFVERNQGNANWKNLRFNTNMATAFVMFSWFCPYYEGIDSYWYDGTYEILSSANFYEYIGHFNNGSSSTQSAEGTLTIKSLSFGRLFTFSLYDERSRPIKGRVITSK